MDVQVNTKNKTNQRKSIALIKVFYFSNIKKIEYNFSSQCCRIYVLCSTRVLNT